MMQRCSNHKWKSLLFIGCSFFAVRADADVIHVPGDQPTIQAGIDAAGNGDEVVVADGIYTGPANRNLDFGGKLITVRSANGADNCTIDCQYAGRAFTFHSGETSQARVQGFTITEGLVLAPEFGGAIRCENSSPTIADCVFVHNVAYEDEYAPVVLGGAIHCHNSSPTILNCAFHQNSSAGFKNSGGGAISATMQSNLSISGCSFTENGATWGGGVFLEQGSSGTLIDCAFSGNIANWGNGGGLRVSGADLTIIDCVFSQNYGEFGGGGLTSYSSTVYAEGCLFVDNFGLFGGAAETSSSESKFVNCRFIGNQGYEGGGLRNSQSDTALVNCVLSGNRAQYGSYPDVRGGAMFNRYSIPSLTNCTLSGNSAGLGLAGGIYSIISTTTLTNCVLWGNSDSTGTGESAQLYSIGWAEVDYSCIQGLTGDLGGTGNIGDDPLFVDPDGPDDEVGTLDDDTHLQSDSPAINAGAPCFASDEAPTDIDGEERIQHCRVDMGADESPYFAMLDCNGNGVLDACDAAEGSGSDCNCNGVLDECEIEDADCNNNGVPDECDIADGTSDDCNGNGSPDVCDVAEQSSPDCNDNAVPDECDVVQLFVDQSEPLSPLGDGVPLFHTIPSPPLAVGDVTLSFTVVADLEAPNEYVTVLINSTLVGQVFQTGAVYCSNTPNTAQLVVSTDMYNDAVDGGDATIMMIPSPLVDADACFVEPYITVAIQYAFSSPADTDGSGIPDECEAIGDLDGDGDVDAFDLALLLGNWGPCKDCTTCPADLDGSCTVGPEDLAILLGNWG